MTRAGNACWLVWDNDSTLRTHTQGIETVRRDNCRLVRNMVTTCLEFILIKRDVDAAQAYVKVRRLCV